MGQHYFNATLCNDNELFNVYLKAGTVILKGRDKFRLACSTRVKINMPEKSNQNKNTAKITEVSPMSGW